MPLCETSREAELLLLETSQLAKILQEQANTPFSSFTDFGPAVLVSQKSGTPEIGDFLDIASGLKLSRSLKKFFSDKKEEASAVWAIASEVVTLKELEDEINRVISIRGEINENATPSYKKLVKKERNLKNKLAQKIESLLRSSKVSRYLQDGYSTIRDERFVLPVKAEHKGKVKGIIHGCSSSGATLFIEPEALVGLNNDWKISELAVEREKLAILKELAETVSIHAEDCGKNLSILVKLDAIFSRAKFSIKIKGTLPSLNTKGVVSLRKAAHPLLLLSGKKVIANDFHFEKDIKTLVISGANTGGKTVTLKMAGLFALMVRAGLLIPAEQGGKMGFFPMVFADIGDPQKLEKDISSFSGHLIIIASIIKQAKKGSLILFDELVNSTDPNQGAALAEAVLKKLNRLGMKTIVTTHYPALKILGQTKEGFENISVVFDQHTLSPTYKLKFGFPGNSHAITIARRLGFPDDVLGETSEILQNANKQQSTAVDSSTSYTALTKLESERSKVELELKKLEEEMLTIKNEKKQQIMITERLRSEEKVFLAKKKRKMDIEIDKARNKLMAEWSKINEANKKSITKKKLSAIRRIEVETWKESICQTDKAPLELKNGDIVFIPNLMQKGTLLEEPNGKKKVRVRVKEREVYVETKSLRWAASKKPTTTQKLPQGHIRIEKKCVDKNIGRKCDLHGLRAEEAKDVIKRYLDKAVLSYDTVYLIHGRGTGTLRKIVIEILKASPYVASFHSASYFEGGEGVTVAEFK